MLWLMRRPWMKRLQRRWHKWVPEERRFRARSAFQRQNRWARKWGLPMLKVAVNLFFISALITVIYRIVWALYLAGEFEVPRKQP